MADTSSVYEGVLRIHLVFGDASLVADGRESFPSLHSSMCAVSISNMLDLFWRQKYKTSSKFFI